ncbi:bestrophin family protein [Vogesella sp. LIG4]|uniref:bestrophin family protein n=1 Tax=Vogesella sp. LIG4 TaxID=1192162 RepID=UPI00081F9666|nr:bestrophin family ion channel [Vogesella sp. LIG4]SCK21564.1 putative membrane protein [Vogesella sp. LIG4]
MIVRPRYHWFSLLFIWRGSVVPRILSRLMLVLCISLLACLTAPWWVSHHAQSSLNIYIFTLLGVSLAIFLGFRNSASYDRFWEARKLWGALLIAGRELTGKSLALAPAAPQTAQLIDGLCAFIYALKGHLRQDDIGPHLQRLLPEQVRQRVLAGRNKPALVAAWLQQLLADMRRDGCINDWQWQMLDRNMDMLLEAQGGCERISGTPIPFTYRVLLNRTVTIYCMLLPIGLTTSIGWLTPLIAVFVAYTFLALDTLGDELEEPFGKEGNDLPLAAMSHNIEASLREIQGVPLEVEAPRPEGIYLH